MEIINRRIEAIGSWLLVIASIGIVAALGYKVDHSANAIEVVFWIVLALIFWAGVRGASKNFFRDPIADEDRRALNAERAKEGLEPIRDPTFLRAYIASWIALLRALPGLLVFGGLALAIVGGVGAVAIDLLFLSKSFGMVAQWGLGAFVVGFSGLGLAFSVSDNARNK